MKLSNKALETVRRHGVEHTLWCLGLKSYEVALLRRSDPELHEQVTRIRNVMHWQLAMNRRNVSYED